MKYFKASVVLQLKALDTLPKGLPDLEVNLWGLVSDLVNLTFRPVFMGSTCFNMNSY